VQSTFRLTRDHRAEFDRAGVLRLPGFFDPATIAPMADALWADLSRRHGIEQNRPGTWTLQRPGQYQALERTGVFDPVGARLEALVDAFLGAGQWDRPRHWGQPLVTFPTAEWEVPHATWHIDLPATHRQAPLPQGLPGVRVFTFLEPVRPRGGGTPFVAGSHKVVLDRAGAAPPGERLKSADLRAILQREEPWFAALFAPGGEDRMRRFMVEGGVARGFPVRVEEMTGEPGDLIVMHPAMLHTVADNALDRPRMMLVQALYRRDW
jgi:hypothetical protein